MSEGYLTGNNIHENTEMLLRDGSSNNEETFDNKNRQHTISFEISFSDSNKTSFDF